MRFRLFNVTSILVDLILVFGFLILILIKYRTCLKFYKETVMDVFLMVRRKNVTLFVDAKESTTVIELKKIIRGILKKNLDEMLLYKDNQQIDETKTLGDVGYTSTTAKAQSPATVGLVFRLEDGSFEPLEITELSTPPDLPEVMKPQENVTSHAQECN